MGHETTTESTPTPNPQPPTANAYEARILRVLDHIHGDPAAPMAVMPYIGP